ncbi:hypothetical protein G7Z17_g10494 [Cylindrodendrum hubeiense]|uniref:Uncharacterized protein n=1 Tax=Cylindrodendrum hubeiense TaxID=595255 RepID=A0A9P5GXK5_9HYPO|nr:hypothetical protein G7Z17_g10494 [Cylindrodendrum hubeiense]
METKKRLSLDGLNSGGGPSTLRRLTRSPSHRLSLRRSSSASSSSSVSVASDDSEASSSSISTSCVNRDTAQDECALYRFIVWAAVKRNACDKMTPDEKRECPMLRCRKRFPNHELMLQHLYICDQLAVGEYWCYDCAKVERFSDAKCKRCLGHPSRRRKIMSMAKNFFSSLGHKNKNSPLMDLDLDIDDAPPSYDSLLDDPAQPSQFELFSTEIHEIDSCEISLPTILEDADEAESGPAPALTPPTPMVPPLPIEPLPIRPVELESAPIIAESFFAWPSLPDTVAPTNLINQEGIANPDRPVLQVHTHDLEQYRAQAKKRSKMLAPSSSVRSNASTASTNSTSSTASYNISPMSAWSGPWARVAGFESTLTSPADDLGSPGGLLRNNSFLIPDKPSKNQGWNDCDNGASDPFFSELPADIPMMDAVPNLDPLHNSLGLDQSVFSFDASVSSDHSLKSNLVLTDDSTMPPAMPQISVTEPVIDYYTYANPRSLIGTAWDALEMHVVESMDKLQRMSKNHLVNQLRNMPAHSIAMDGLEALVDALEGRRPATPVKVLCFVHVIYSFSLVVHEQDAPSRWTDLFGQAMSYSSWFTRQDRQLYIQIVDALWKPSGMTETDVVNLVRAKASSSMSRSSSLKGKEPESVGASQPSKDSLVVVAQYFLDQLEYSAIHTVDEPEIQTSQLCMQHLGDTTLDMTNQSPLAIAVNFMLKYGFQEYTVDSPSLLVSLDDLLQRVASNYVSTSRRLELELMHAGKMCLPSEIYFDSFISCVRMNMDSLYTQNIPNICQRNLYYQHGVKLMETIITASQISQDQSTTMDASRTPALDSLDDVIKAMTPHNVDSFDWRFDTDPQIDFPGAMTIDPGALGNPQLMPTPEGTVSLGGPSTAATSPPSPVGASAATKIESNSCCELCGYRPKGDPRWFGGSMAKHKKLQHATTPPKIYRCPFPGCTSQYKNRPDNLRQHQIEKGHFVDGQEDNQRPSKRKKVD